MVIARCEIHGENPAYHLSRVTCGIWFGVGNLRRCSVCGIGFCGRYAIAPFPLSRVGALEHSPAEIALIALD